MSRRTRAAVLFTDLVGSTELLSQLGDHRFDEVIREHFATLRGCVARHGGHEVKNLGDGLMVVFGDATSAAACSADMQTGVASVIVSDVGGALGLRVGVHHGDVIVSDDTTEDYFGTTVVVAKRLCDRADRNEILVSHDVRSAAGDRFAFEDRGGLALKGLSDPVRTAALRTGVEGEPPAIGDQAGPPAELEVAPLPAIVQTELRTPMAGRRSELARFSEALDDVARGANRLVLLGGEPGMGKTRLTCEVARLAHGSGYRVLFGRCDEEGLLPYQPFVESLRHAVTHLPADERAALVASGEGRQLARLVPDLQTADAATRGADHDADRHQLLSEVTSFLARLGESSPTLMILDDLQWADTATVLLLKHVARLSGTRLLVLGTFRDVELPADSPIGQAIAGLRREQLLERVQLTGLDRDGVARLVANWAGQPAPPQFVDAIWQNTEGHPLFTQEVLRHLLESGALYDAEGRLVSRVPFADVGVPEGVTSIVDRRIARLSEETRRALTVGAVVGREFGAEVIARVVEAPEDLVLEQMEEALAAGVLVEVQSIRNRFRFAHALFRESIYSGIGTTRRARLHERIAESLERELSGEDALPELAHHFFLAATSSDLLTKAVGYALAAAERAELQLAYEEAAVQLDRAVRGLTLQDPSSPELCRALVRLGTNRWMAIDYTPAREAFQRAVVLADVLGLPELMAEAALGYGGQIGFEYGLVNRTLIQFLETALERLGDRRPDLRCLLQGRLGEALVATGDRERSAELVDGAVLEARALGDPVVLGRVLSHAMLPKAGPDDQQDRVDLSRELLALAAETNDAELELGGRIILGATLVELADIDGALREVRAVQSLAEERREPYFHWLADMAGAAVELGIGDLAAAEAMAWNAMMRAQHQNTSATQLFGVQMLHIRQLQGRLPELRVGAQNMAEYFDNIPALRAGQAMLLAEIGWHADARREIDRLALDDFASVPRDVFWLVAMYLLAESVVRVGGYSEVVSSLYRHLAPYQGRVVLGGIVAAPLGFIDRALGILAAEAGDLEAARRHLEDAIASSEEAGFRAAKAVASVDLVGVLRRLGGHEDRAAALEADARATAAELGLRAIDQRLDVLAGGDAIVEARPVKAHRFRGALINRGRSALARLIGDASDDELERRFGTALAQRALFTTMASSFQPSLAYGIQGDIVVELVRPASEDEEAKPPDWWTITIEGERATARHRMSEEPLVLIRATVASFLRVATGVSNGIEAWMAGDLMTEGDVLIAAQLVDLFGAGDEREVEEPVG
jgi:class 3 adenylate cyclase/tetratricopeptide (TPR) repeat protein